MYSSTGISLKSLLSEHDMMEPEDEADLELIAPNEYHSERYRGSKSSVEILPGLPSPEWFQAEMDLAKAYNTMASYLSPRNIRISGKQKAPSQDVVEALKLVGRYSDVDRNDTQVAFNFPSCPEEVSASFPLVESDIEKHFASIKESTDGDSPEAHADIARMMSNMFDSMILWQSGWNRPLKHIDIVLIESKELLSATAGNPIPSYHLCSTYVAHFQGLLHSFTRSSKFHRYLEIYFRSTLPPLRKMRYSSASSPSGAAKETHPAGVKPHKELHRLGYLPKYSSMLVDIAYERIKRLVRGDTDVDAAEQAEEDEDESEPWSRPMLAILRKEVQSQVVSWLYTYISSGNEREYQRKPNIDARIEYALQSALFEHRVKELFDIIVYFPDSQPGLEDIRDCTAIHKPIKRTRMIEELGAATRKRLLHPGAETKDIITQYVSTIRAVKIVDASGILLHAIAAPIQAYLQQRKDTINCIVTMLLESNDLIEEGEDQPDKIKPVQVKYEQAEDWSNPNWDPEPIDAAPEFHSQKASDIISTFVGMYESREVIMIEVQQWLAKRLLEAKDYDVDAMIMDMEKLKLRFGDAALHVCDIMLKDLADSKRINNRIQSECQVGLESVTQGTLSYCLTSSAIGCQLPLRPKILSHLYWPAIKEPKFRLPKKLQKIQQNYGYAYHKFRQDKKLKFYHQGTVVITVQLGDRELELEVTLLQAAVLEAFSKKSM
ncbi:hypothetical protein QFC21_001429 [Naganishia friedmannii]|uniref:Uncharacterized protein n=1 Tax=Naganishia friedmannii TaxID=89922 RepID=A0ACC2W3G5_9TREE|nr:hypothetical protein QFC21_001429 [Naganishia friedmannii]